MEFFYWNDWSQNGVQKYSYKVDSIRLTNRLDQGLPILNLKSAEAKLQITFYSKHCIHRWIRRDLPLAFMVIAAKLDNLIIKFMDLDSENGARSPLVRLKIKDYIFNTHFPLRFDLNSLHSEDSRSPRFGIEGTEEEMLDLYELMLSRLMVLPQGKQYEVKLNKLAALQPGEKYDVNI